MACYEAIVSMIEEILNQRSAEITYDEVISVLHKKGLMLSTTRIRIAYATAKKNRTSVKSITTHDRQREIGSDENSRKT